MIRDLYDNSIVAYKTGTGQEARLFIDEYMDFYKQERIQTKTSLTPLEKRRQAA